MKIAIAAMLLCALLAGCRSKPPVAPGPFIPDRAGHVAQSISLALDAQRAAATQLLDSLHAMEAQPAANIDPDVAYERNRSALLTCESRIRIATETRNRAEKRGERMFEDWRREILQYSDQQMREKDDLHYRDLRRRFRDWLESLDAAHAALETVRRRVVDLTLWTKHNRAEKSVPAPPTSESALAQRRDETAHLEESTHHAEELGHALIKDLGASPQTPAP